MRKIAEDVPGYSYGGPDVARSPVSLQDLERLKTSARFTDEDQRLLELAGEVLANQTEKIVAHWRSGIIASIPNLAHRSRSPKGDPLPKYLAKSTLRFQQWILATCFRPYDQDWLNYQQEIALRHTSAKKNKVDGVRSTSFVPLREVVRIYCGDERDHQALPDGKWPFGRRGRKNAPRIVQVHAHTDGPRTLH